MVKNVEKINVLCRKEIKRLLYFIVFFYFVPIRDNIVKIFMFILEQVE